MLTEKVRFIIIFFLFVTLLHSAGNILTKVVDDEIAGLTSDDSTKKLFSTSDQSTPNYARNPNNWLYQAGLVPSAYSAGSNIYPLNAICLVAPDVGITAWHQVKNLGRFVNNAEYYFVTADSKIEKVTILSMEQIGSTDIAMVKFNSKLSSDIGFFKVFPKDWATYFTSYSTENIPFIYGDAERKTLVGDISNITKEISKKVPVDAQRLAFHEEVVPGDSSDPLFTFYRGDPVLLSVWRVSTAGPFISDSTTYDAINTWMAANSDYQLTDIDMVNQTTVAEE